MVIYNPSEFRAIPENEPDDAVRVDMLDKMNKDARAEP